MNLEREQILIIIGACIGLIGWLIYHLTKNESFKDPNETDYSSVNVYGL